MPNPILRHVPDSAKKLLISSGPDFIEELGIDAVKTVVASILCGENLRDSTELLTRKKLALLNAATLVMFVRGMREDKQFAERSAHAAAAVLAAPGAKIDRWILQWLLGLTDKAFQNVLRDKRSGLANYADGFDRTIRAAVDQTQGEFGELSMSIDLRGEGAVSATWSDVLRLLTTIGAQTLAVRGSDKSLYGKLFERLVLGSVLNMLGLKLVPPPPRVSDVENVFWLSSTGKREADATVLCGAGRGVRFDIGFIGRGNTEISLDKVSRFERELDFGRGRYYMATIIVVDRIGERSKIVELAKKIDGRIVQMSGSYWPRLVAKALDESVGYRSQLLAVSDKDFGKFVADALSTTDIKQFIRGVLIEPDEQADETVEGV